MKDEELKECGCNSCGCGEDHEHDCGCGCEDHDHEEGFIVDLEDEEGNIISCPVTDAFEFEGGQYVLVENPEDHSCYLFKSLGEEGELVVPEEAEFERVTSYYESLMDEE